MDFAEYPAFYRTSDLASRAAQTAYLRCIKLHLAILVVAAVVGGWSPADSTVRAWATGLVGLLLLAAMCIAVIMKVQKYDDRWFQCRAFAENTKSNAWRFVAQRTFNTESFMASLGQIKTRFTEAAGYMAGHIVDGEEITAAMTAGRELPLGERADLYAKHRLCQQRTWYRERANTNARKEHRWFIVLVVAEAVAIALAILAAASDWDLNPTGAVSTLAAAGLAWAQTKRFSDLATSYGSTAQDLSLLAERVGKIHSEAELEQLVDDVEDTVSREHRLWLSHRCASVLSGAPASTRTR